MKKEETIPFSLEIAFHILISIVIAIMLAAVGLLEYYFIRPSYGVEKSRDILMFVLIPFALFSGAGLGKALIHFYALPAWKRHKEKRKKI